MIKEYIDKYMENKEKLIATLSESHPGEYKDLVKIIVELLHDGYGTPDPEKIHEINDGYYQGCLVYIIAEEGYQPYEYWYVRVSYGSCSGCDTLESIRGYDDDKPTKEQVKDYMDLLLHIVQGIKKMGGDLA